MEPFVVAEHLEYKKNWKSFITPYLSRDELIGTSQFHHFCFYKDGNLPHIQSKMYVNLKLDTFVWKQCHQHNYHLGWLQL
jgi:hypothetical protein